MKSFLMLDGNFILMTNTPNHGYNTPGEGSTDWHIPLNKNFDKLDSDVEIRDSEVNKGDYEPKEGAKYEATDSGAIYYGNGSAWILADRDVNALSARSVNNVKTPKGTDIESFRTAAEGSELVKLKPGVTYEWDETFVFDPLVRENSLRVEAHKATINHSSDPAVDVKSTYQGGGNHSLDLTWIGGKFDGPGKNNGNSVDPQNIPSKAPAVGTGSSAIRITDGFNHDIKAGYYQNVKAGVYARNVDDWSEGLNLSGGADSDTVDFCYLCLGEGYVGRGSGTNSFRGIQIEHDWGSGRGGSVTIYQGQAGFHGGSIYHTGNLPEHGWGWWADGNLRGTDIHWESEGGKDDAIDIQFEGNAATPPPFTARLTGPQQDALGQGGGIVNNRYGEVFFNQGGGMMGMQSADEKKGYRIPSGGGNDRWEFESPTMLQLGSIATNNPSNLSDSNTGKNVGETHTQIRFHDGSEGRPAGWYWWDETGQVTDGSLWVKIGQPSVTISPY